MEIEHVLVTLGLLVLENAEIILALSHLVPFALDHDHAVKGAATLEAHEGVDHNFVRVVDQSKHEG